MEYWLWLVDVVVLSSVVCHNAFTMVRCLATVVSLTTLSHLITLTLSSLTKVRMVSPTCIVSVGVWVTFDVCSNFCIKQACIGGVGFAASHRSHLINLLYRLNIVAHSIYL